MQCKYVGIYLIFKGDDSMLPLLVGSEVTIRILSLLLCKPKDVALEAEKRGIERAARIYAPILAETQACAEQLKLKYSFDKDTFGSLIDKKVEYIKKLEQDTIRYKEIYKIKLEDEIEQYNSKNKEASIISGMGTSAIGGIGSGLSSTMGSGVIGVAGSSIGRLAGGVPGAIGIGVGFIAGRLINRYGYLDRAGIKKREEEIKAIENLGFEKAKVMWEKQISEHRAELDALKYKGDKESRELIEIYDECISIIAEKEKVVAYYQERVGDLG